MASENDRDRSQKAIPSQRSEQRWRSISIRIYSTYINRTCYLNVNAIDTGYMTIDIIFRTASNLTHLKHQGLQAKKRPEQRQDRIIR